MSLELVGAELGASASPAQPFASEQQARAWLASFEPLAPAEQRHSLMLLLQTFPDKPRYESCELDAVTALEQAWSPIMAELQSSFRRSPSLVTNDTVTFHEEMARISRSYARIYRSLAVAAIQEPRSGQSDALPARLIGLALFYLGKHAKFIFARNEVLSAQYWNELHSLYALAVERGFVADLLVSTPEADFSGNCEQLWVRPLMLATVGGSGLTQRQIYRAEEWLQKWCSHISVDILYDPSVHVYYVDTASARGAQRIAAPLNETSLLYLGTSWLYQDISATRAQLIEDSNKSSLGLYAENPLREYFELLERLQRIWLSAPSMQSRRADQRVPTPCTEAADTVRHLGNILTALGNSGSNGGEGELMTVVDRSHSGFGLLAHADRSPAPDVRELIAVRAHSSPEWKIGVVVRATASPSDHACLIGVHLLSHIAIPVTLSRMIEKTGGATTGDAPQQVSAFYIIGDASSNRADGVLAASRACNPGDKFKLKTATDEFLIQINRIIEGGVGWERLGFQVIEKLVTR